MPEPDDQQLLASFIHTGSESAFAALVARYMNLVYSAALRFTGNPAHAQEITQAVFIVLVRKARELKHRRVLAGWLYQTTRLTAANSVKREIRRQRREQEAYMQSTLNDTDPATWQQLAPLLDEAMGHLGETDRTAVVLRYFENRSAAQVAAALNTSEGAVYKRVTRSLDKLRKIFARRGVMLSAAAIAAAVSANSVQAAPAALAQSITAAALAKGAAASISSATVIKTTLAIMKSKTVIASVAVAVALGGAGTYLAVHFRFRVLVPPTVPMKASPFGSGDAHTVHFANADFGGAPDNRFVSEVDPGLRRTPDADPAGHIKSTVVTTATGAVGYLASLNGGSRPLEATRGIRYSITNDSPFLGKRVRISGWVKTRDVENWVGGMLLIINSQGHVFADDENNVSAIRGATDWQMIQMVADVPHEPCVLFCGATLYGAGEFWTDGFELATVPSDTPVTDDRIWHMWSPNPNDYAVTTDSETRHDNHPSLCITYLPDGSAPAGSWMWWGEDIRTPGDFLGHTVRMTAWIKTEHVTLQVSQNLRPKGPNFKLVATCTHSPASGTTGWTEHVITCVIPKSTQCLDTGFAFTGSGKVWIDMTSLKYEIAD